MENIYLVGFMATGKSSVGKELAKQNGRQFIDLDDMIEAGEKRSICDIFASEGEPYFRKIEKQLLKKVSANDKAVVACGGGIIIDPANIKLMKETGTIVCLSARSEVIIKRTKGTSKRPLLNIDNPEDKIKALQKARAPFYALADFSIDTSDISVKQVAQEILDLLSK